MTASLQSLLVREMLKSWSKRKRQHEWSGHSRYVSVSTPAVRFRYLYTSLPHVCTLGCIAALTSVPMSSALLSIGQYRLLPSLRGQNIFVPQNRALVSHC